MPMQSSALKLNVFVATTEFMEQSAQVNAIAHFTVTGLAGCHVVSFRLAK